MQVLHIDMQVSTAGNPFALPYRFTNLTCTPGQSDSGGEIIPLLLTLSKEEQVNDSQTTCPEKHRNPARMRQVDRLESLGFYQLFASFFSNGVVPV